jgi:3-dehydroquinate synthase
MKIVKINSERKYEVRIGANWREELKSIQKTHKRVLLIIPANLKNIIKGVSGVEIFLTPDGELQKNEKVLFQAWKICGEKGLKRDDAIVAVGGGATTDLGGFVAATWLRGIKWYAFPTSIAGAVDAAIGGKTGINSQSGKNLIGSFNSPNRVVIDLNFFKTLPKRDLNAGLAEVVKAGFIADRKILNLIVDPRKNLEELIFRAVKVKAKVVSKDFKEGRLREILNYGHTLAHAIEKNEKYKLRHGEAVSIGLIFAAELSNVRGVLSEEIVKLHRDYLESLDLPTSYKANALKTLLAAMKSDKKSRGNHLRFIGLERIGKPVWFEDVSESEIKKAYARISQ